MLRRYAGFILLLSYFSVRGQVVFDQLPRDLQLYPRGINNQAEVIVSGKTTVAGYAKIGLQVLREGKLTAVLNQTLNPALADAPFTLKPIIKAEPAEYAFRVFAYKGADSTLVAERKRVVCGDVYIIYGQSNALALAGLETYYSVNFDDKYFRNATYPYNGKPADMSWYAAKQPYGTVGGLGLTIQRLILQNYGIPTCVLNGAQGGTALAPLVARDPVNHANTNTFYGQLLYRAQWAGVAKQAKAIIWRQGEEDAGTGIPGYAAKFTTLYNQLREDYGNLPIYVGQINILADKNDSAAAVRDFQRRTKYFFKNVETIATVGTPGYQGVHYEPLAYQQLAFEQFRQLARDIYGAKDTLQIDSPDVQKVFFNTRKDSITLVFEEPMQMVWTKDTTFYDFSPGGKNTVRQLKDYFYPDGQPGLVAGGSAVGNRIILALKQPSSAKTLRYLPAYFSDSFSAYYDGPVLKNSRGMRAFSFDNVPIASALPAVLTLAAKPLSNGQIQLNWTTSATAQTQVLERSEGPSGTFKPLITLAGTTAAYVDANLPDARSIFYYRLRGYSSTSESAFSNVASVKPVVLGLEPTEPLVRVFPNPVAADQLLQVGAERVMFTQVTIRNTLGQVVKNWLGPARPTLSMALNELESGLYVVSLQTAEGQWLHQKILIR